jgi:serine/threonine protein kinase
MVLQPGARLGPYEIVTPVGAGGMGEVYKARDTRLDRTVAIKVLSPSLAVDPAFRERFDREARTISSLDHPHICVLYDVGHSAPTGSRQAADVAYLVMQFLEGETLAARLERGALPVAQALEYASQIAAALDRAHRAGIVHRDLKPGNVMLVRAGGGSGAAVKLLDFGLAKAPVLGGAPSGTVTMTTPLTGQGTIVGTLQYMAPEQLEGRDVDARTDIFALGAILYEMLTGKRAFEAASQAGVMAAILEKEPPAISTVQPLSPPGLDRIVQRCLAKDPDARWQSASDLAVALSWVRTDSGVSAAPAVAAPSARRSKVWRILAFSVGSFVLVVLAARAPALLRRSGERAHVLHAALPAPPMPIAVPEISPDGTMIVWSGSSLDSGGSPLWLQPFDSPAGRPIPGTEGATYAFWSRDSRTIGFFQDQKLKRVAVAGGVPFTICDVPDADPRGGTWGAADVIVFAGARIGGLSRVQASGGTPQPLTTLDKSKGHTTHRWPLFLPDGRHFVYFASPNLARSPQDEIVFGSVDGSDTHVVLHATSNAAYADGRLLYVDKDRLVAQPFDPANGTVSGDPAPVLENVRVGYGVTRGMFAAVGSILVAMPDESADRPYALQWIAKEARTTAVESDSFNCPSWLSPDGHRVVTSIDDRRAGHAEVVTIDLESRTRTRLTFGDDRYCPVWSRDGTRIFYTGPGDGGTTMFVKALGGGAEAVVARQLPVTAGLNNCSDDYCVFDAWKPETGTNADVFAVRLADGAIVPIAVSAADEDEGSISPDGSLLAYIVGQGGLDDVYVRTFPSGSGVWQVSTGGGREPFWSRDGRTLYYSNAHDLVSVEVSTAGGFTAGPPHVVVPRAVGDGGPLFQNAQIAPDGRLLVEVPRAPASERPYRLVLNWDR